MRRFILACVLACPVIVAAQSPQQTPAATTAKPAPRQLESGAASAGLAVRRVILYKTGVGYFEHLGNVRDRQNVTVRYGWVVFPLGGSSSARICCRFSQRWQRRHAQNRFEMRSSTGSI